MRRVISICTFAPFLLALLLYSHPSPAQTQFPSEEQPPASRIEIQQLHPVEQGASGWFAIEVPPQQKTPVTLRLQPLPGTGAATFAGGSQELLLTISQHVEVRGLIASDLTGGYKLTAWDDDSPTPLATAFFDVLAPIRSPRIFWNGLDITDRKESVIVGQQIALEVPSHPSLAIREEHWTIDAPGAYVGGFVHTLTRGGPQPIVVSGPATTLYWIAPAPQHRVTYTLVLTDGQTASASVSFSVDGPSFITMDVPPTSVSVGSDGRSDTSYLTFAGTGMSFRAQYLLPEGTLPNYTWVQLVTRDVMIARTGKFVDRCVPKSQPIPDQGAGLDTSYPYDWHNPTRDSPPLKLTAGSQEISRTFHARMYLLWGSGMSNSIAVPLGYVDWHFEGRAVRKDIFKKDWSLEKGSGGPDDAEHPFHAGHTYPLWNSLVPYAGLLRCE